MLVSSRAMISILYPRCHKATPRDPFQGPSRTTSRRPATCSRSPPVATSSLGIEATGRCTRAIRKCRDAFVRARLRYAGFAPVVTIARHVLRGLQPALTRVRRVMHDRSTGVPLHFRLLAFLDRA